MAEQHVGGRLVLPDGYTADRLVTIRGRISEHSGAAQWDADAISWGRPLNVWHRISEPFQQGPFDDVGDVLQWIHSELPDLIRSVASSGGLVGWHRHDYDTLKPEGWIA